MANVCLFLLFCLFNTTIYYCVFYACLCNSYFITYTKQPNVHNANWASFKSH